MKEEGSDEVLQEGHAGHRLGFRLRGTHDERGSGYRYRLRLLHHHLHTSWYFFDLRGLPQSTACFWTASPRSTGSGTVMD